MQRVVTGKVRLSYVNLFAPHAKQPGQEPKYSATLLIPKSDVATKQRIDTAIQAAVADGVSKWNGVKPPQIHFPIHDGDGVKPSDGMPFNAECKGHWVMTASSKATQKPDIVDINLNPILNQSEVYSGCYARVSIRFFPYNANGKKGIGCGLGNVQKLEDGEPLAGGRSASDDFGSPQHQYSQQPQQPIYQPQQPQQHPYHPQPQPQHPGYGQSPQYQQPYQPQQQGYGQHQYSQQPQSIDPITGAPVGGVMGI